MEYIDSSSKKECPDVEKDHCIFCAYAAENDDEENLILVREKTAYVILNRYPYSVGHLLVVPYRHTALISTLSETEKQEIFTLAQKSVAVLEKIMNADGFNIGMNLGRVAGAGIDTHLHLHVVPRWNGDINFMSVTAETKVLPEALRVTRRKLLDAWNSAPLP
jgi:ATP adenylyltransferase